MNAIKSLLPIDPLSATLFILIAIVIFLILYLIKRGEMISILKKNILYLNQTVQELDHQAKLIIKSDMEIKLYQEEVEDKLNKLALLKELILSSIHILDRNELFSQITQKIIHNLGFKKGVVLDFNGPNVLSLVDFQEKELEAIKKVFTAKKEVFKKAGLLSSPKSPLAKELAALLHYKDILLSPIKAREETHAVFILCGLIAAREIKKAEEEIFSIICMYLGQCLDNIKLFEDLYHTKDELEKKIKERTNELIKSLRVSETMSKLKSDFISSVSHELRTPLTSVKGFASLLVEEKFGKLPPQAKNRLEKIDENVNKLVTMVNTLLDISRIESGKIEVNIAPHNIVKTIKDAGDLFSPQLQNKTLSLTLNLPDKLTVYMDKDLIERVLINLINNAIKFTPRGGKITIGCIEKDRRALISVSDSGCGIEKENLEKIFQEFFRVDNSVNRSLRGSGLGLSLVKRIINTHKEKIWVESNVGKGTAFYFTLKIVE